MKSLDWIFQYRRIDSVLFLLIFALVSSPINHKLKKGRYVVLGNRTQGLHDDVRKMDPLYRLFELACNCLMHISCFDFRQKAESVFGQKIELKSNLEKSFFRDFDFERVDCFPIRKLSEKYFFLGQEPWSSGYGRRLMRQRSWVWKQHRILGGHFIAFICCKNCNVRLKRWK